MKKELRKLYFKKRKEIVNKKDKDQLIINNLNQLLINYNKIMIYYPISCEPNILDIVKENKNYYLPYCENNQITIRKLENINDLEKDEMGILSSKIKTDDKIEIVIVPALAMNKKMFRLGYGGGFYDKFLSFNKNLVKVAVVYDELIVDDNYQEEWDIQFDYIVTEKEIIKREV